MLLILSKQKGKQPLSPKCDFHFLYQCEGMPPVRKRNMKKEELREMMKRILFIPFSENTRLLCYITE